jgi:hypothetical protein
LSEEIDMEKYELSLPEKIIIVLLYAILPVLIFAIVQSAVTHGRGYYGWLFLIGICALLYLTAGVTLITVPLRFRKQTEAIYLHTKTYLVKNGLVAFGNHLRFYPVFSLKETSPAKHSEAIDPFRAREVNSRLHEGESCTIWVNSHHPSQCCTNLTRVVLNGIIEIVIAIALCFLIFLLA